VNDIEKGLEAGLFSLLHAAEVALSLVESSLEAVGLSLPKLAALHALTQAGESMQFSQLAERLACVKSNITQLVDRLEADGLVVRGADPNDRRSRIATLTAKGRKAYQDGDRIRHEMEKELFGGLSADEARQLATLMEKVTQRAK
jgi:MarR family 2-MHQ and catechol resistance regulon transcriptional repressor